MMTLAEINLALNGKLNWKPSADGLTVTFYASGKKLTSDDQVQARLEALDIDITPKKLRELILDSNMREKISQSEEQGEISFVNLPPRESQGDDDITEWDELIWKDVKFIANDNSMFYVKDSEEANTYSAYLTGTSTADKSDAKILREAFYRHVTDKPEQILKTLVKDFKFDNSFNETMYSLPVSAWNYIKIKAEKRDKKVIWHKLVIPAGSAISLYEGFINLEGDFRSKASHQIKSIKNLTNNPEEAAIAYIDLKGLNENYKDQSSTLWDNFLLERLHSESYMSIFKAWIYAVAVGKNNSRQEMWLYGNGGTGKSVMCKALIAGFNNLAGKDICLAASKDSGKSQFNSELLNKHFMVYSDAKNLKQGMSEAKHNITGGDYMRIEGKGKEAVSAKIYMKCLSCSNERPQCDMTDRSQSSRYIVLPFTLSDQEMKEKGLMRADGSIIGSATFEEELTNEFPKFLASCKDHYMRRCETDSNIDAHEANEELDSINLTAALDLEDFVHTFFEITNNNKDRVTQKDFRAHFLKAVESFNDDGIKLWETIKFDDVRVYMEKKFNFQWKNAKIDGVAGRAVVSPSYGLRFKDGVNVATTEEFDSEF